MSGNRYLPLGHLSIKIIDVYLQLLLSAFPYVHQLEPQGGSP